VGPTSPGLVPPVWKAMSRHEHEAWAEPRLPLHTARLGAEGTASRVCDEIAARREGR